MDFVSVINLKVPTVYDHSMSELAQIHIHTLELVVIMSPQGNGYRDINLAD